jgi:hypothetical protein
LAVREGIAQRVESLARYSSHMINDFDPWLAIDEIELLVARGLR